MAGKNRQPLDQSRWTNASIEFPFRASHIFSWPLNRLTSHMARCLGKEKPFRPERPKGFFYVAGVEGLEPPAPGFGDRCSTN
jgi:hypothetical protein